jgi:RNA polymerase sigma-70 factor (ECF subfamily)
LNQSAAVPGASIAAEATACGIGDFDAVAQQYWSVVFRFLFVSWRDRDAAETLTQDCFLKAYRHRERFRGDSSVKSWDCRQPTVGLRAQPPAAILEGDTQPRR